MVAQFALSSKALPDTNRLRAIRGVERLSQPYSFDLVLELEPDALADLDAPVGKPATIQLLDAAGVPQDSIHGILATLELVDAQKDRELYLARLVPRLWWFGQNRHSRMFVDDTLPQIIDKVLRSGGWGDDDFRAVLKGGPGVGFPALEHVCQYRESDLDFLSRWMEREGIYYYFESGKNGEKLVVTDDAQTHKDRKAGSRGYVPRSPDGGSRVEGFHAFRRTSQAQPAGVRLADYNYMHPDLPVHHEEKKGDGQLVSLFGENLTTPEQAQWLTKLRSQELAAHKVLFRGSGHVHGIHPADQFSLEGHPRLHDAMLAIEVVHRGLDIEGRPGLREPIEEVLGEELDDGYAVEVVAIPATVQYRPPRVTPAPRITGMESAVVDGGVEDIYAQLDDHGRYNVRFKFDESDLEDGKASTRMRMVQPHGGANEGFHFPLRKGTEVMVGFVGGDPDRPIITGVSPNAHKPSVVTRANATQNVVQTGGGNKLVMEDTKGKQWINAASPHQNSFLHLGEGSKNFELSTDGGGMIRTGANLEVEVGGGRHDHVKLDMVERFDAMQDTEAKTRKDTVHGTVTEKFEGHHEQKVTAGGVLREVTGGENETIKGGRTQTIEDFLQQTINGPQTLIHEGKITQTVNGGVDQTATAGSIELKAPAGTITAHAQGPLTIQSDTGITNIAPKATTLWPDWLGHSNTKLHATWLAGTYATLAINAIGTKAEIHGMRLDATKIQINNTPLKLQDVKMRIVAGALILQLTKFTLMG